MKNEVSTADTEEETVALPLGEEAVCVSERMTSVNKAIDVYYTALLFSSCSTTS